MKKPEILREVTEKEIRYSVVSPFNKKTYFIRIVFAEPPSEARHLHGRMKCEIIIQRIIGDGWTINHEGWTGPNPFKIEVRHCIICIYCGREGHCSSGLKTAPYWVDIRKPCPCLSGEKSN